MVYVFIQDFMGAEKGTRLFLQDDFYYFKNSTEHDFWLTPEFVKSHPELFRQITATEFMYGVLMVEGTSDSETIKPII